MDNKMTYSRLSPGVKKEKGTLSLLSSLIFIALTPTAAPIHAVRADPASPVFDTDFLKHTPGENIDISRFERGVPLQPGDYRSDIYVNDKLVARENLAVRYVQGESKVCLAQSILSQLGLKPDAFDAEHVAALNVPSACVETDKLIPSASTSFSAGDLRLDIHVPQASLLRVARGSVDPSLWDAGENALFVRYNANVYQSVNSGRENQSYYGAMNVGYNLNGWMLRHNGSLRWTNDTKRRYNSLRTYAQHDITPLKAMLTLGDAYTSGELFDTFSFRGVQLATDERMLPDTQRGYAPVIRGTANTSAHVTVSQNGSLLYDTTVPPGEFVIDDLYPTGYGGDLLVTVEESNGQVSDFTVPYASVAQLLRPGATYYSAVAGTLRDFNLSYTPKIFQATIQRGVTNGLTAYSGFLSTGEYHSGLLGMALGTPVGALAFDVTAARISSRGMESQGASYRITYSKLFAPTNSNLSIAAYRFSTSGYLDLNNAMLFSDYARHPTQNGLTLQRPRNRLSVTASQGLNEGWGQIYLSGYSQNYWDREGHDNQYQAGYGNTAGRLSYTLSANRVNNAFGNQETHYQLSLSVPLGTQQQAPNLNMFTSRNREGIASQTGLNGLLGDDNQFSYNIGAARDANRQVSGSLSSTWRTPYNSLQGNVAQGTDYHSFSVGTSGSFVALADSVTASPYSPDTLAVVSAPDAGGAKVEGYSGIVLNENGLAVVPYLTPYRMNTLSLNPEGLSMDVALESTSQRVAPRAGAVVKLTYPTSSGRAALIRAVMLDGEALPFGAPVTDNAGLVVGTVAQGGQIYARLSSNSDRLQVKWGEGGKQGCAFSVTLPERDKKQPHNAYFDRIESRCESIDEPRG